MTANKPPGNPDSCDWVGMMTITCDEDTWFAEVTIILCASESCTEYPDFVLYSMPNTDDCPAGVYTRCLGQNPDAPASITVEDNICPP